MRFKEKDVAELNKMFTGKSPEEILKWAMDKLHPNVALATSFQAQGIVLIDMLMKIKKDARIFTLDTGRLNQETYDIMDEVRSRYKIQIEVLFPNKEEVEKMVFENGVNLFYRGKEKRLLCCKIRKTNPLNRMLKKLDGWITSIRRDQTESRADAKLFELDALHGGILKINPLVDWNEEQVWEYIRANKLPYNKLYDKGYRSIGCAPCTRPVGPEEDPRAGRWWWESDSDKECGIHFSHSITDAESLN